jgi:hypothetical protein
MHSKALTTFALTASLALATLTAAGPRRPPPIAMLTHPHQWCTALGMFAEARGHDRNGGIPLSTMLTLSQQWDQDHGVGAALQAAHEIIIRDLYGSPHISPEVARETTLRQCLQALGHP